MKRRSAAYYRRRQDQYIQRIVEAQTPAERAVWAEIHGGWHEHTCKGCQTTFTCALSHGAAGSTAHRCEACLEKMES